MKIIKKLGLVLLVAFLLLQAFRPTKNDSNNKEKDIATLYPVSDSVQQIFNKACNDCHSNNTNYPWYANIQPVAWWLSDHVKDGKKEFNLNDFASYRIAKQYKKLEEFIDEVKDGEMPLESYTLIHKNTILSSTEKALLLNWADDIRDSIRSKYPADSLIVKKKK